MFLKKNSLPLEIIVITGTTGIFQFSAFCRWDLKLATSPSRFRWPFFGSVKFLTTCHICSRIWSVRVTEHHPNNFYYLQKLSIESGIDARRILETMCFSLDPRWIRPERCNTIQPAVLTWSLATDARKARLFQKDWLCLKYHFYGSKLCGHFKK